MLPSEYVSEVVLPTVDEFLAATGELRRAILACVVSYHVRDYLAKASGCSMGEVDRRIRAMSAFSFDVVEGVCNGSLHVRNTKHGKFKFTPGDEKPIPVFALDEAGSGLDEARFDIPGLEVEHQGRRAFIDVCLCAVLGTVGLVFPAEFSGVDLEGYGKRLPGWPPNLAPRNQVREPRAAWFASRSLKLHLRRSPKRCRSDLWATRTRPTRKASG
jgi:hypothetical protein